MKTTHLCFCFKLDLGSGEKQCAFSAFICCLVLCLQRGRRTWEFKKQQNPLFKWLFFCTSKAKEAHSTFPPPPCKQWLWNIKKARFVARSILFPFRKKDVQCKMLYFILEHMLCDNLSCYFTVQHPLSLLVFYCKTQICLPRRTGNCFQNSRLLLSCSNKLGSTSSKNLHKIRSALALTCLPSAVPSSFSGVCTANAERVVQFRKRFLMLPFWSFSS